MGKDVILCLSHILKLDEDFFFFNLKPKVMDSDSDSPFNYSWPSFPKMRMRRKTDKKGKRWMESTPSSSVSFINFQELIQLSDGSR